jgi:hypothetical protein
VNLEGESTTSDSCYTGLKSKIIYYYSSNMGDLCYRIVFTRNMLINHTFLCLRPVYWAIQGSSPIDSSPIKSKS